MKILHSQKQRNSVDCRWNNDWNRLEEREESKLGVSSNRNEVQRVYERRCDKISDLRSETINSSSQRGPEISLGELTEDNQTVVGLQIEAEETQLD